MMRLRHLPRDGVRPVSSPVAFSLCVIRAIRGRADGDAFDTSAESFVLF
jgi:hypothetical protein